MNNKQIKKEEAKCKCHCHEEHNLPDGVQCRCIKNCIHCRPENFPSDQQTLKDEYIKLANTSTLDGGFEGSYYLHSSEAAADWWLEKMNQQQKDFDARVEGFIKEISHKSTPSLARDEEIECCNCGEDLALESYEWYSEGYQDSNEDTVALAKQMLQGNK